MLSSTSAGATTYLLYIVHNVFATLGSLKTDVSLTLIELLKSFIRFNVQDLTAFTYIERESIFSCFRFIHFVCLLLCGIHNNSKIKIPMY